MPSPGVTTLATVRNACFQQADMPVTGGFITVVEANALINASYYELYDLLTEKYDGNWFIASPFLITTDGVNDHFNLPSDFYKLKGVDLLLAGTPNSSVTLRRFNWSERNRFSIPNVQTLWGLTNLMYQLSGSQIWFIPLPAAAQTVRLWYAPRLTALVNDSDTLDGVSGWEEYVKLDVVTKMLQKEETDVQSYLLQKAAMVERIEAAAAARDAGQPPRVSDVSYGSYGVPWFGGSGWDG